MDTLEQAAMDFDAIDRGDKPSSPEPKRSAESLDMGDIFGDMGVLEVDENSPPQGGGDNLPLKGAKAEKRAEPEIDDEDEEIDPNDPDFFLKTQGKDDQESDNDADDEDDEGDEEDDGEDGLAKMEFEVTVDGDPTKVNMREALNGYIRQETFHRRLNELNEYKSTLGTAANQLLEDRKKAITMIEDLQKITDALIPKEPDWDAEYARDPAAARRLQKQYDEVKKLKDGLAAERSKITKEQQEEDEAAMLEYRRAENLSLLQSFPHWGGKDGEVRMRADLTAMKQTLLNERFTEEEIKTIYDSRMVKIAMKAARYDRLMAGKIKPVRKGNHKPLNSGAGPSSKRTAPKGDRQAITELRKTGSVEAAGRVFADLISKPRRK